MTFLNELLLFTFLGKKLLVIIIKKIVHSYNGSSLFAKLSLRDELIKFNGSFC